MIKRIEWRGTFWSRLQRSAVAIEACTAPVLSPERARELDQPTWLRRGLSIDGLGTGHDRAGRAGAARA
ncbi:MAG TPA: hypothetical protein VEA81_15175 [Burkholderiaceae bacterium]|nr:hypothetical protein [Burkholderiaceae bacterium]